MLNKIRGAVRKLVLPPLFRFAYGKKIGELKTNAASYFMSFERTFSAIRMLDIPVGTVIDVGASNGCWSQRAVRFFPDARFLLIEANPVHEPDLEKLCTESRYEYSLAAAGPRKGEIFFDMKDPFSGKAREEAADTEDVRIPATSIDYEVESRQLSGPYLIKLDTHGFEIPILKGAENTLSSASVVIIEAYAFQLSPECLKFYDLCRWMTERGFEVFDICTPMWREKDNALWQMDIVFLKNNLPLFQDKSYR